jgi:hypothetical protein
MTDVYSEPSSPRPQNVIILAGGYSVKEQKVNLHKLKSLGHVIGVNESGYLAPVHEVVSMDRLWMENRYRQVRYLPCHFRKSAWKSAQFWTGLSLFENTLEAQMSKDKGVLNGNNSGLCALNLAYQYQPENIYLFGFDHYKGKQPYWHNPYPWANINGGTSDKRYGEWVTAYGPIAEQFKRDATAVFNVSPESNIEVFPKLTYQEFLKQC